MIMNDIKDTSIWENWRIYEGKFERSIELIKKLLCFIDEQKPLKMPFEIDTLIHYMGINIKTFDGIRYIKLEEKKYRSGDLALSFWMNNEPYILLNKYLTKRWKRFCIAHELYHLLSPKCEKPEVPSEKHALSEEELLANEFASLLLMPEGLFERYATLKDLNYVINLFDAPSINVIDRILYSLERFAVIHLFFQEGLMRSYIKAPFYIKKKPLLAKLDIDEFDEYKVRIVDSRNELILGSIDRMTISNHLTRMDITMAKIKTILKDDLCMFSAKELGEFEFRDYFKLIHKIPSDNIVHISIYPIYLYPPTLTTKAKAVIAIAIEDNYGEFSELNKIGHKCVLPPNSSYRRRLTKAKNPIDIIEEFKKYQFDIEFWADKLLKALSGDPKYKSPFNLET